jgi:hypothetical protein
MASVQLPETGYRGLNNQFSGEVGFDRSGLTNHHFCHLTHQKKWL